MLRIKDKYYYLKPITVGEHRKILEFNQSLHSGGDIENRQEILFDLLPRIYEELTHGFFKWAVFTDNITYYNPGGKWTINTTQGEVEVEPYSELLIDGKDGHTKLYQYSPYIIGYREQEINKIGKSYLPIITDETESSQRGQNSDLTMAEHYEQARKGLLEYYHFIIYGNSMGGSYMTMQEVDNLTIRDFVELGTIARLEAKESGKDIKYDEDFVAENNEKDLTMSLEQMQALAKQYREDEEGGEEIGE